MTETVHQMPAQQKTSAAHYDDAYFAWQRDIGELAGVANRVNFAPHVRPTDNVLDFGCGGGYLLAGLDCRSRMGIEVNATAREEAKRNGITVVASSDDVPDGWADVVISNSALEHVEAPLTELRRLRAKLKVGGRLVAHVPHETIDWPYAPNDVNQHLYTWSPMALGNLVTSAGFHVDSVTVERLVWPPRIYRQVAAVFGHPGLRVASRLYRALRVGLSTVRIPLDCDGGLIVVATRQD